MKCAFCDELGRSCLHSHWRVAPAIAQPYPNKPIHVVVPVTAGGLTDVIARRIAADASARMGQPWIMENKPGANFIPAAESCRHAKGDGYTLCVFTTSTMTFNPHLIEKLPYDAAKDFKPIINLGQFIGGLIASPKLGVKTIEDLRHLTLAKSGEFNFGTYGPASSANVFRQYLAERWNTPLVEVAYKGSNELIAALASGEIQMTWTALGSWVGQSQRQQGPDHGDRWRQALAVAARCPDLCGGWPRQLSDPHLDGSVRARRDTR